VGAFENQKTLIAPSALETTESLEGAVDEHILPETDMEHRHLYIGNGVQICGPLGISCLSDEGAPFGQQRRDFRMTGQRTWQPFFGFGPELACEALCHSFGTRCKIP
jgi:hypothetical protein